MRASFSRQDKESPVVEGHPLDRAYKTGGGELGLLRQLLQWRYRSRRSSLSRAEQLFSSFVLLNRHNCAAASRQAWKALIPLDVAFVCIPGLAVLLIRRCASLVKDLG